jgi:hypothetical protein
MHSSVSVGSSQHVWPSEQDRTVDGQSVVWWVTFAKIALREKPPLDYGIDVAGGEEFSW